MSADFSQQKFWRGLTLMAVKQPFLRLALKHSAPKFRLFGATLLLALSDCESEAKKRW
jgi:hypothetical protein